MGKGRQEELYSDSRGVINGAGELAVIWVVDPSTEVVSVAWTITDQQGGQTLSSGACESPTIASWEFGEAGWLVRKLRQLAALTVPF